MRMPWGKFKGVSISEIESSYLCWCLDNADALRPDLREAIAEELGTRFGRRSSARSPMPPRRPCPDPTLAVSIVSAGLRTLAKKYHPDLGGDTATMQRLTATADWLKAVLP